MRSADPVRIGIKTSPQDTDWPTLDATWARIGEHDVFESAWVNDHLTNARDPRGGAIVLSMPPQLGSAGIDAVVREIATPLREGLG